ncbi:hypothetical protein G6F65_013440 [Rhizopus arrhizus]|nr:hypothetical protein G6F65_013440 [Rhizopus arrhizus]
MTAASCTASAMVGWIDLLVVPAAGRQPMIVSNPASRRPAAGATEASKSDQGGQGRARQRRPVGGPAGVVVSVEQR